MPNLIARLRQKHCRQKGKTKYWILELQLFPTLTKSLLNSKPPKTTTFYLFNQKARWASRLQLGQTYYWIYQTKKKAQQCYYQIQDWKLLGEVKTVRRCTKFLKTLCQAS